MPQNHILVTGSTGKTGRRIVRRLAALGEPARGVSRRSAPAFHWEQPDTWLDALRGARSVYVGEPFVDADDIAVAALTDSVGFEHADLLTDLCRQVFDGRNEFLTRGVQEPLGREPRNFTHFCRAAAESGVWTRA